MESVGGTPAGSQNAGLYGIAVASELTGVNPPMLRAYEDKGLLKPARSSGGTRRYSNADLSRVERITALLGAGLNLAGVAHVLDLEAETERLRAQVAALRGKAGSTRTTRRVPRE